jgi:hypothetical protein
MKSCREFRERLGAALEGTLVGAPLAWHEHLVACEACRALFEAEEALDELLACLPEPELPVALARRILRRLETDRALDRALDQVVRADVEVPDGLAARVLAGLQTRPSLDELLERQPEPEVPAGLSARVLVGLADELIPRPILRPAFGRMRRVAAAAATVLIVAAVWRLLPGRETPLDSTGGTEPVRVATHESTDSGNPTELTPAEIPDPELLAALDVLEDWELLVPTDVDLLLGSLDESDAELLLLDLATDPSTDDESEG